MTDAGDLSEARFAQHRDEAPLAEVRQVLGWVVVIPASTAHAREERVAVAGLDHDEATGPEQLADASDRSAWIAEVLDDVEQGDDVEARGCEVGILESDREHPLAELPRGVDGAVGGRLDAERVEALRASGRKEKAVRGADVEETRAFREGCEPADAALEVPEDEVAVVEVGRVARPGALVEVPLVVRRDLTERLAHETRPAAAACGDHEATLPEDLSAAGAAGAAAEHRGSPDVSLCAAPRFTRRVGART
jgi:hypothetical protein